ncbi:hypothetical protein LXL04_020008 [Taraxacum kok-saghyz]
MLDQTQTRAPFVVTLTILCTELFQIEETGRGVLVYLRGHEGRGIGLGHLLISEFEALNSNCLLCISPSRHHILSFVSDGRLVRRHRLPLRRRPPQIIRTISTASYGPTWRLFRRNLASEILHPVNVNSYSWARKWVLQILLGRLQEQKEDAGIKVIDHFTYAMLCLLVLMCFGEKLDEHQINEISRVQREMLFRNRLKEFEQLHENREDVLIPLIQSRIEATKSKPQFEDDRIVVYVDTLVNLQLPEEDGNNENGGKLTDKEMIWGF